MSSGKGIAGGAEQEPPSGKRRSSQTGLRLTLVMGMNVLLVALILVVWAWSPANIQLDVPLSHAIQSVLQTGISSRNLVLAPPPPSCTGATHPLNPITAENACAGTDSWRQTLPLGATNAISAFPAPASVNIGHDIHLYVTTTASTYTFSVYRVGWYQGHGARLLYTSPRIKGINQPAPIYNPVTYAASDANWRNPVTLYIPASWVSGVYIVKFITSDSDMRYTLFVVRNDASHAPVLFQMALATYQAYNDYGGRTLYGEGGKDAYSFTGRAYAVSFDRPYAGNGLFLLPRFEGPLILFLERTGYDMSYMADVDLELHPQPLMQHKLLIIGGHDEYWSTGMRQAATNLRDHGVSLAFFSSNSVYWKTRMANSPLGPDRIVICYKTPSLDPLFSSDPAAVTTQWASSPVSQPQNSLLGEMYNGIPMQPEPLVLAAGARPYLTDTQLYPGSVLPGLVYGETDGYIKNGAQPPHVTILAASTVHIKSGNKVIVRTSDATIYTAPSGAMVFDTGTFDWYLGLNSSWPGSVTTIASGNHTDDLEQFTINILNQLIAA